MVDKLNSTDIFVGGLENFDGDLRAAGAINAGDLVKLDGTETGNVPNAAVSDTAGEDALGVALYAASAAGDPMTVAQVGAEVRVNATGTIAPGNQLIADGTGAVKANDTVGSHAVGIAKTSRDTSDGECVMLVGGAGNTGNA